MFCPYYSKAGHFMGSSECGTFDVNLGRLDSVNMSKIYS